MTFHGLKLSTICLIVAITIPAINGHGQQDEGHSRIKKMKPSYIRTELKVSRSLNPDDVETIDVKSNTGGFASIIVKKRPEGRVYSPTGAYLKAGRTQPNATTIEYGKWNPVSSSVRFAEPTDSGSLHVINSFIDHIDKIERNSRQDTVESSIKNDRRPVNILLGQQVPEPTVIRSDAVFVKSNPIKTSKRGKSLMSVDTDGIPVVEGIRVPDDEDDKKKTWRNARVIKGELVPYEQGYVPPKAQSFGELVFTKTDEPTDRNIGPFSKADNYNNDARSLGPFTVDDNKKPESVRSGGGPFFVADNSATSNSKLIEYIRKLNSEPQWYAARSSKQYQAARPQYTQGPQLQRRMLPGASDSQQHVTFLNDIETAESFRNPVFEYAHPELGIQPAKAQPKNPEPVKFKKVQYYINDNVNSNGPKKFTTLHTAPLNSNEYYQPEPYYGTYNVKQTATYPYNYGYLNKVKDQPLWLKISEQVRDSFHNGMTSVGAITRPVFDPIVEAGHKISENLGFSKNTKFAQSKVGVVGPVAAAGSAILPAIGLVAGGAALGIGAIAVGKYFDGNILKRENGGVNFLNPEHKRDMPGYYDETGLFYAIDQPSEDQSASYNTRQKRSLPISNRIHYLDIEQPTIRKRTVPSTQSDVGDLLQNIEKNMPNTLTINFEDQIRRTDWTNTPCAKKTFCEVMLQQSSDQMVLMEKKMETLLATMHPKASASISNHLTDVIQAINQRNCEVFLCVTQ